MRVGVVGLGLIGGSVALAARKSGHSVAGFDINQTNVESGLDMGLIDVKTASLEALVDGADAVFIAVPLGHLPTTIAEGLDAAPATCVVTDVGSLKRGVAPVPADPRFVGGHPLAGAESAGSAGARADLFEGATWYLTPSEASDPELYERLAELISGFGAKPVATTPELHDELMALVSHLPHVLANILVAQAAATPLVADGVPATGPSFRDATRVAGSNTAIWADIYLLNRHALSAEIDDAIARLREVQSTLATGDPDLISAWNDAAAADRRRLRDR
jgi:prephenate dehydrogenase